ncbi:conjugal transfer protein TrbI [Escherichia coli]|nr:conjugal transfer protein TrbI [Escherichia coli]
MSTHDKDNEQGTDLPLDDAEHHNEQQKHREEPKVDDDPDMRVDGASPDFLAAPKRGKGVRRLNRLPLLIVGGVVGLAVLGVTYTMYDRQQQQMAAANGASETRTVGGVAKSPVQPGPDAGAPPAPPEMPTDAVQPGAGQQAQGGAPVERGGQQQNTNSAPPQVSQAMQDRLQKIKQVEDRRFQLAMQSLDADSSIELGRQADRNANANGAAAPGMMPVAGQGRVSADELMNRYMAANGLAGGGMGAGGPAGFAGGGMGGMGGMGGGNSMAAENQQDRKQAFLANTPEAEVYLARQKKAAIAPSQEVKAGWVIPGVMISGINSDLPGQIIGQVREAVYDSATGTQCLIPPGSRVVGTYDSGVTLGQTRALAVWRRIIYPDGSSISIDNMPGTDMGGYAGFNDKVNNHYARIFGSGLLLSVFSAGIQLSQPQASNGENYSSSQIIAGSLGQQLGQIGMQMAQRNMNIQPTLEIRPGYEFNIMVTKDIILPTWEGHPMAGQSGKGCN